MKTSAPLFNRNYTIATFSCKIAIYKGEYFISPASWLISKGFVSWACFLCLLYLMINLKALS